jgi:hypothetical protein
MDVVVIFIPWYFDAVIIFVPEEFSIFIDLIFLFSCGLANA